MPGPPVAIGTLTSTFHPFIPRRKSAVSEACPSHSILFLGVSVTLFRRSPLHSDHQMGPSGFAKNPMVVGATELEKV